MISEKDIEIIEAYLRGELSENELVTIEEKIKSDKDFASQVEMLRDMSVALKADVNGFNQTLASVMISEERKEKKVVPIRKWLMVAAAIAALMVVFFLFNTSSPDDLYTAYFEMPPENVITRNDASNTSLDQAITAYKRTDYRQALSLFDSMNPKSTEVVFYSAMCHMAEGNHDQSVPLLESIQGTAGSLNSAVEWYLGLSHFQLGNNDQARDILTNLAEIDGYYARQAREFLSDW